MKTQYLVVFYDKKQKFTCQFIVDAINLKACLLYVQQNILSNAKYEDETILPASMIITEVVANKEAMELVDVNSVFLINCDKLGLIDIQIKAAEEMKDGKTVKLGASNMCMSVKALEKIITEVNLITQQKSFKASIHFLHNPILKN